MKQYDIGIDLGTTSIIIVSWAFSSVGVAASFSK